MAQDPVPQQLPAGLAARLGDSRITSYGLLHEAHRRLSQTFERSIQARSGISAPALEVMLRVGRSPEGRLMMSELSCQLGLTSGGVTRLVDRVVEAGYVERAACPGDRRVQWVVLTPTGQRKLDEALDVHLEEIQHELVDRLDPEELAALERTLDKLRTP